jgi:enamine deaminase RidA (YjgF/YER057c/UK114 family)
MDQILTLRKTTLIVCLSLMTLAVIVLIAKSASTQDQIKGVEKQFINPPLLIASPNYTHIVSVRGGKTIFVSGQVAYDVTKDPQRRPLESMVGKGDYRMQAKQAFTNLRTALEAAGARPSDVVKINVYVKNYRQSEHLGIISENVAELFPKDRLPASTVVGVQSLALDELLIEVEAVAVVE